MKRITVLLRTSMPCGQAAALYCLFDSDHINGEDGAEGDGGRRNFVSHGRWSLMPCLAARPQPFAAQSRRSAASERQR